MWFDAHCHPDAPCGGAAFSLCCSTFPGDWAAVSAAARPGVIPCYGVHPWRCAGFGQAPELEVLLNGTFCCLGEAGLDAYRGAPPAEQLRVLALQLELAARAGRPACLHCAGAWGALAGQPALRRLPAFLVHGCAASPEMVRVLAVSGGYFSFGPRLAAPSSHRMKAALAAVPRDRLLLESEPGGAAGFKTALAAAAELLGLPAAELEALTLANGRKFLGV
jgi:TatD DNase family protein